MRRVATTAGICLVLLAGCVSEPSDSGPAPASGTASQSVPVEPDQGMTVDLEISAPAVEGAEIDLTDYAGQDLALWFWAPW